MRVEQVKATNGNEHTSALESKTGYTYLEIEAIS